MSTPRSLDLTYDRIVPLIERQLSTVDALNQKAATAFSLLTVLVALGASLGIAPLTGTSYWALGVGAFGLALYLGAAGTFLWTFRLRDFVTQDNAEILRDDWIDLDPAEFQQRSIDLFVDRIKKNKKVVKGKYAPITCLIGFVPLLAVLLIAFLSLSHAKV